jgi:K(+)-stimulated pyrophosphate-energized sodium pump
VAVPLALLAAFFAWRASTAPTGEPLGAGIGPEATAVTAPEVAPISSALEDYLGATSVEAGKRFVFDHLNFEFATSNLTPESLPTLDRVAEVLKAHPNTQILLEGHTDATGVASSNERLSRERANAVKAALVARGVSGDRIATAGVGQDRPIASNDTEEGRARNRRTELVVTKP